MFRTLLLTSLLSFSVLPASAYSVNYGNITCIHYDTGHINCFPTREGYTQEEEEFFENYDAHSGTMIPEGMTREEYQEQNRNNRPEYTEGLYPSSDPTFGL